MRTLCVSLALVLALASTAFSSVNAGPTWNQVAASRHFDEYPVAAGDTFAEHYHGSNLAGDFASMVGYINQTLNTVIEPGYDDLMNASLEDWGTGKTH
jgi:hypothetical protein